MEIKKNGVSTKLIKSTFSLEGLEGRYTGFTYGERWNGWECPFFTYEECEKIINAINLLEFDFAKYDKNNDRFIVIFDCNVEKDVIAKDLREDYIFSLKDNDLIEKYNATIASMCEKENQKLYPLGYAEWIWTKE